MTLYTDHAIMTGFDLTGDAFIDSLFSPDAEFRTKWATVTGGKTQISYSFAFLDGFASKFTSDYGPEPTATQHFGVTNAQIAGIDLAFQRWADVANISFSKVTENASGDVGDIRIGYSSAVDAQYWGYTQWAGNGATPAHGDIWIEPSIKTGTFAPLTYDFNAMMHEIGHALGLDHPFEGNIIPAGYDDGRYTIMSYTDPKGAFYFPSGATEAQYIIATPMVYDIAAVQKIYGANMSFHTGNDKYAFKPSQPVYQTIWDAGGTDTLDVSTFTKACSISLVPGTYSLLGYGDTTLVANIGIAFKCIIENANGGQGDDTIVGNDVANVLRGNGGNDTISGGAGNDVLIGGLGNDAIGGGSGIDTASYATAIAAVTVNLGVTVAQNTGSAGQDTIKAVENLTGSAFADSLTGSSSGNVLIGGKGADTMAGGLGNDVYGVDNAGDTVTEAAGEGRDLVLASTSYTLSANIENLTLTDAAAIDGSGNDSANVLRGNAAANVLSGGGDADQLFGGDGNDTLIGGAGRDFFTGGTGADTFRFAGGDFAGTTTASCDRVMDFNRAEGDKVDLSAVDANSVGGSANDAFAFIGSDPFGHVAGQLRAVSISGLTVLQGDSNGDGVADLWIRFNAGPVLAADDLIL